MKKSGACQPAQSAARSSVARVGPNRDCSRGSAYPRPPASSPKRVRDDRHPERTDACCRAAVLDGLRHGRHIAGHRDGGKSEPEEGERRHGGELPASLARPDTIVVIHRRTPVRPSFTARTTMAAIRGPSRPGKPPLTTIGSHHAQLSAYASTKNMTSGGANVRARV
jgi:hypothetical protein